MDEASRERLLRGLLSNPDFTNLIRQQFLSVNPTSGGATQPQSSFPNQGLSLQPIQQPSFPNQGLSLQPIQQQLLPSSNWQSSRALSQLSSCSTAVSQPLGQRSLELNSSSLLNASASNHQHIGLPTVDVFTGLSLNGRNRLQDSLVILNRRRSDGTSSSLDGAGTSLDGAGTSRQARQQSRNNMFGPYSRRQPVETNTSRECTKTIILLPDFQPKHRPVGSRQADLAAIGFGSKDVVFCDSDSVEIVTRKIYNAHPLLHHIIGGIQMYQQDGPGNSTKLRPFNKPVLLGHELRALQANKVFVATLLRENFPEVVQLSGTDVTCPKCHGMFDMSIIRDHNELCIEDSSTDAETPVASPEPAQDVENRDPCPLVPNVANVSTPRERTETSPQPSGSVSTPRERTETSPQPSGSVSTTRERSEPTPQQLSEGFRILDTHKHEYLRPEDTNEYTFLRASVVESAHQACQDAVFMSKIRFLLVVKFEGEIGVDQGGLLRHLLSTLMDCFELGIEETHRYFQNSHLPTENDEYLSPNYLRDRLYSFGVFSALAIVQANMFPSFVLHWVTNICQDDHPFIIGLNTLGVARLIQNRAVHPLFIPIEITLPFLKSMFVRPVVDGDNDLLTYAQDVSFGHFENFLEKVFNGQIRCHSGPMTGKQVFQFITGSWIVPRTVQGMRVEIRFQVNARNVLSRPVASTCFGNLLLPITRSEDQMGEAWVSAIDEGGVQFNRA